MSKVTDKALIAIIRLRRSNVPSWTAFDGCSSSIPVTGRGTLLRLRWTTRFACLVVATTEGVTGRPPHPPANIGPPADHYFLKVPSTGLHGHWDEVQLKMLTAANASTVMYHELDELRKVDLDTPSAAALIFNCVVLFLTHERAIRTASARPENSGKHLLHMTYTPTERACLLVYFRAVTHAILELHPDDSDQSHDASPVGQLETWLMSSFSTESQRHDHWPTLRGDDRWSGMAPQDGREQIVDWIDDTLRYILHAVGYPLPPPPPPTT
ncbi:hypothetical protein Rhopal_005539-T1 [Rhodotorula paludigena]|uniref:Uncharacterized protein n=1 Tax=Rhodotorula paludigena TaxID=86838 RepID=A0AAV5GTE1_9BASI|nr:hypothetical protein Rhopal_005539-T1 [Rhodotorula paludigena]